MKTTEQLAVEKILDRMSALARYATTNEKAEAIRAELLGTRRGDRVLALFEQNIGLAVVPVNSVTMNGRVEA
jgi:hypothetical protein